jgi:hypothetical protein
MSFRLNTVVIVLVPAVAVPLIGCMTSLPLNDERAVLSSPSPAPTPFATPLPLDLNGIDVGTKPDEVIKKLGRPLAIKRIGENPCGGRKLTYQYRGLAIDFDPDDERERDFMVVGLQLKSGDWIVGPGIGLGITEDELAKRLGRSELNNDGRNVVTYGLAEGRAYFYLTSGKVTRIEWAMNLC